MVRFLFDDDINNDNNNNNINKANILSSNANLKNAHKKKHNLEKIKPRKQTSDTAVLQIKCNTILYTQYNSLTMQTNITILVNRN